MRDSRYSAGYCQEYDITLGRLSWATSARVAIAALAGRYSPATPLGHFVLAPSLRGVAW